MTPGTSASPRRSTTGTYLQIYPSTLVKASRMMKIAKSLHEACHFGETHLVGVHAPGLADSESLAPGVTISRIRGSGRRGNLGRVLRAALWQPRVYLHYHRESLAVVAAHNVWVLPLCWLLSRASGAPLVYNAHELETETATMRGLKKRVAKAIESLLVTRCAVVSVVNEPIADWYTAAYPIRRPVVVGNVPIVLDAEVNFRDEQGVRSDEMLYVHTGHLTEGRNIPLILDAFSSSRHHVVFLGDGHLLPAVLRAAAKHPNIHWMSPVEPDLIVAHMREADVGLCLIEDQLDLSDRFSSPNKLLEALAAHTPALCSNLPEARRLLAPLAETWILSDPATQLPAAIERIGKADVAAFRSAWAGTTTWATEVEPLILAFRALHVDLSP